MLALLILAWKSPRGRREVAAGLRGTVVLWLGNVAGGHGWGMCHGRRGMAPVTSSRQLRLCGFCCELTVMGSMGNINWINVH